MNTRPISYPAMFRRMVDLSAKAIDRADYLSTLARLSILDRLARQMPESPVDRIRTEEAERLRQGIPEYGFAIRAITFGEPF